MRSNRICSTSCFGLTRQDTGSTNSFNGTAFSATLGLQGPIGLPAFFNGLPEFDIGGGITPLNADRLQGITHGRTIQVVDNLTWNLGKHTLKFGFDYRHIEAIDPLGFLGGDN